MGILSRKSISSLQESELEGTHTLRRHLGAFDLVMLGIGAIIGAGLFSITGIAAAESAGPAIVISFLIAALGSGFAGLCYSEMAVMIPVAGSAYTYAFATIIRPGAHWLGELQGSRCRGAGSPGDRTDAIHLAQYSREARDFGWLYLGDLGDAAGTVTHLLFDRARWIASSYLLRYPPCLSHSLALQPGAHAGGRAVRCVCSAVFGG